MMQAIGGDFWFFALRMVKNEQKRSTIDVEQQMAPTSTASHASWCEGKLRHSDSLESHAKEDAFLRVFTKPHFLDAKVSSVASFLSEALRIAIAFVSDNLLGHQ